MTFVFIFIAIGAGVFLTMILLEYLKAFSALKPKADLASLEIRDCETKIEGETVELNAIKAEIEELQKEVADLEIKVTEIGKFLKEHKEGERRRNPTKFKL